MTRQEQEYLDQNTDEAAAVEYVTANSDETANLDYAVANGMIDPADVGEGVKIESGPPKAEHNKPAHKKNAKGAAAQKVADERSVQGTATTTAPPSSAPTDLGSAIENAVETSTAPPEVKAVVTAPAKGAGIVPAPETISEVPGSPQTGKTPLGAPTKP